MTEDYTELDLNALSWANVRPEQSDTLDIDPSQLVEDLGQELDVDYIEDLVA